MKDNNTKSQKRRGFLALAGSVTLGALISPLASKARKINIMQKTTEVNKSLAVKIHPSAVKRNTKGKSV
jgi:hypothetical protein